MKTPWSALLCAFTLTSVQSLALADEPSLADWARGRVEEGLLKPLAASEAKRGKFSRSRPPPRERRVKVVESTATLDKNGKQFVRFTVDSLHGEWQGEDIVGCVYREKGAIFVKSGEAYRPAAFLLGKNVQPVAGACVPAAPKRS